MVTETRGSELEDPLSDYSGLSLLPRTMTSLQNPPKLEDLRDPHTFLKSMPFGVTDSHKEQAKVAVDNSSEFLSTKVSMNVASKNKDEGVAVAKAKETNRERRPGLGRERARFSLKPVSSQPTVDLEPTMDLSKLQDPEEFFSAFERLENAKKEIQRQKGAALADIDQNQLFTAAPRPRRPGIAGRIAKYKHRYSFLPSQDTFEQDRSTPWDQSSQQETINVNLEPEQREPPGSITNTESKVTINSNFDSEERELAGSVTKTENNVSKILDELLSDSCEDLDGDGAVSLLREQLQIKPIDLEKLKLPDFEDIRTFKVSAGKSRRPRNSSSDVRSLLNGVRINNSPLKQKSAESSASPSPYAPISKLQQHILLSKSSTDPFSAQDIERSPARDASPIRNINQQFEPVNSEKEPSGSRTSIEYNAEDTGIGQSAVNEDASMPDVDSHSDVPSSGPNGLDNAEDTGIDQRIVNEEMRLPDIGSHSNVQSSEPNGLDDMVEEIQQEVETSGRSGINNKDSTVDVPRKRSQVKDSQKVQESSKKRKRTSRPSKECEEGSTVDVPMTHQIKDPKKVQESSKKRTSRPSKARKSKEQSRRQSLAGSGTSWTAGIRRSTRIRSRPLEYWKGERFLYGRIHHSLPTVIGIKYESPAKDNPKHSLKVKSYVSDDYKELVEFAALH